MCSKIIVGKPQAAEQLGISRYIWKFTVKTDLRDKFVRVWVRMSC
jgi:hypothetical protein